MTTTTAPNPLDAALPDELVEELAEDFTDLLALVPALTRTMAAIEGHLDTFHAYDHGLVDEQFSASLEASTPGQVLDLCHWLGALLLRPLNMGQVVLDVEDDRARYELAAQEITPDTSVVLDEVRCRRLVIVDDQGVERIVGEVLSDGPSLVVSTDGLDGCPVAVHICAGDPGIAPGGVPARAAGVHLFAGDDEHAQLEVIQTGDDTGVALALDVQADAETCR